MVGWVCFVGKNALFIIERGRSEGKRKVDIFFCAEGSVLYWLKAFHIEEIYCIGDWNVLYVGNSKVL